MYAIVHLFSPTWGAWEEEVEFNSPQELELVIDEFVEGEWAVIPQPRFVVERTAEDEWAVVYEKWGVGYCDTNTLKEQVLPLLFQ